MNPERLLENNALPFAAATLIDDHLGHECALVIAKLAWRVTADGQAHIAEPQREIRFSPEYFRGAGSSLKYPHERYTEKPGTELLLIGDAWPSPGKKVSQMDVSVRLESGERTLKKSVRLFGPRVFVENVLSITPGSAAEITGPVPLVYELAAGGTDPERPYDDGGCDPVNPVGTCFRRDKKKLVGERAHQLEPIEGSAPAGFGPIARHWSPRAALFGTLDDAHFRRRHPVPPRDFDLRYNVDAHPDLFSATPLQGDEPIEVVGATPEGAWRFRLPLYQPRFHVLQDNAWTERPTKLDTIFVDLSNVRRRIVELTWRCAVRLPKRTERLQKIRVTNAIDVPRKYYDELFDAEPHRHDDAAERLH